MCETARNPPTDANTPLVQSPAEVAGSRRQRLWELPRSCHCPVLGVCLPLSRLRSLLAKGAGSSLPGDDYDHHVMATAECARRSRVSKLLHRELDCRHAAAVRRFKAVDSLDTLWRFWSDAKAQGDIAGAFWAALTHPLATESVRDRLCRDIHMIQHQAGAEVRQDAARFQSLIGEHAALVGELARAQQRMTRITAEKNQEVERWRSECAHLQTALIQRDASVQTLRQLLEHQEVAASRAQLQERIDQLLAHQAQQDHQLGVLRQELERWRRPERPAAVTPPTNLAPSSATPPEPESPPSLADNLVLCVGGRSGSVPAYRGIVEDLGGRYAHHDGGQESAIQRLEASLAAADLIICQTGCISHDAYWRVKDHCKRTGKRCLFVDNPSPASLSRSLQEGLRRIPLREAAEERLSIME